MTNKTTEILAADEANVIVEAAVADKSDDIALDEAVDANELDEAVVEMSLVSLLWPLSWYWYPPSQNILQSLQK